MVSTAEKHGFTLYLDKTGMLTARAVNKSSEVKLPEKLLGFTSIGNALLRIYQLIYNEYPAEVALVPIECNADDYGDFPYALTTPSAHSYLKTRCLQNRGYNC